MSCEPQFLGHFKVIYYSSFFNLDFWHVLTKIILDHNGSKTHLYILIEHYMNRAILFRAYWIILFSFKYLGQNRLVFILWWYYSGGQMKFKKNNISFGFSGYTKSMKKCNIPLKSPIKSLPRMQKKIWNFQLLAAF